MKRDWIPKRLLEIEKTQQQLAECLDLPHSRISDIVYGRRSLKITEIRDFAEFMGLLEFEVITKFMLDSNDKGKA